MALTTGKRQVAATASSVANRMGVVPAYGGDPVSTIAKVATEKLDFFAKRQASLEEAKYKADLEIKTSKFINTKAREFFNDPKSFTTTTDSYIESLVAEAPTRYKSWTKSMISGKAIRKGETIFANRIKQDHDDAIKLQDERVRTHNEETLEDLFDLATVSQADPELRKDSTFTNNIDDYHKNVWLPKVSEMYKSHLEVYNAAYPEDRNAMLTPQEFLRTMQVSFEQLRVNTKVKNIIDTTMLEITEMGGDYQIGNDKIKQLNTAISKMLNKEYMKNPQIDMLDGKATLVNTTKDERGQIISNAEKFMKGHLNVYSNQLTKYESEKNIAITEKLNSDLFGFVNNPNNFSSITPKQLEIDMINLNLNDEQKMNYRNAFNGGQLINESIQKDLQSYIGDPDGIKIDTFSGRLFSTLERKNYSKSLGISSPEDLKKLVIQQHMKIMFPSLAEDLEGNKYLVTGNVDDIRDTWLGTESLFTKDENTGEKILDENNNTLATAKFNTMVSYAKMMGEPIPQLTDFFNDIMNIDVKSETDLMKLDNAAFMVNYFTNTNGFEFMFKGINDDVKKNLLQLKEYHKLRHAGFDRLTRLDVAQNFFESLKPKDTTRTGKIKIAMDNFINYGGEGEDSADQIDLTSMVNKYIKKYQNERIVTPGTGIGLLAAAPGFTSLATGETTFLFDGVIDSMEVDANKVRKVIRPYLDMYLTNMFKDESYVTKQSIEKNLKDAMKFIMEDFANDGFNWKVFSGSNYNE